jgi:hypothetical protein
VTTEAACRRICRRSPAGAGSVLREGEAPAEPACSSAARQEPFDQAQDKASPSDGLAAPHLRTLHQADACAAASTTATACVVVNPSVLTTRS